MATPKTKPSKAEKQAAMNPKTAKAKPVPAPTKAAAPAKAKAEPKPKREPIAAEDQKGVINRSKYVYPKNDVKTATGRPSVDNGDAVAVAIRGMDAATVVSLVEANGAEVPERWAELNTGMQRMNAANVLRRLAKDEKGIKIGGKTVKLEPKAA